MNCQLETQEAFAVPCNNLPEPCSGEKKTTLSSELIPKRLAVRDMEINKILIAIGRIRSVDISISHLRHDIAQPKSIDFLEGNQPFQNMQIGGWVFTIRT